MRLSHTWKERLHHHIIKKSTASSESKNLLLQSERERGEDSSNFDICRLCCCCYRPLAITNIHTSLFLSHLQKCSCIGVFFWGKKIFWIFLFGCWNEGRKIDIMEVSRSENWQRMLKGHFIYCNMFLSLLT